jgi:hypothetical protein
MDDKRNKHFSEYKDINIRYRQTKKRQEELIKENYKKKNNGVHQHFA